MAKINQAGMDKPSRRGEGLGGAFRGVGVSKIHSHTLLLNTPEIQEPKTYQTQKNKPEI